MISRFPTKSNAVIALAPMEGITDAAFRATLTELGQFDFCFSEFVRVVDDPVPSKVFLRDVPELRHECLSSNGTPVIIQILGGNVRAMAASAQVVTALGAPGVDVNFGCPAPQVNRNDGGAALLKDPPRLIEISKRVRDVCKNSKASIKLRLGFQERDEILRYFEELDQIGLDWITVHARTRNQGYTNPTHASILNSVCRSAKTPILINGEVWKLRDKEERCQEAATPHVLLARGAIAEPRLSHWCREKDFLPTSTTELLYAQEKATGSEPSSREPQPWNHWLQTWLRHCPHSLEAYRIKRFKQWSRMSALAGNQTPFHHIKTLESWEQIVSLVKNNFR